VAQTLGTGRRSFVLEFDRTKASGRGSMRHEFTIGIGGAAGDGLDKSGDTLAKTVARRGLYVSAYNSYQSVIRGGHIWLRVRIAEHKVHAHGAPLPRRVDVH